MNCISIIASFTWLDFNFRKFIFSGFIVIIFFAGNNRLAGQTNDELLVVKESQNVSPLEDVMIVSDQPGIISVRDGKEHEYFRTATTRLVRFKAGGYPGVHKVILLNKAGKSIAVSTFRMEAKTSIEDSGRFGELFRLPIRVCLFILRQVMRRSPGRAKHTNILSTGSLTTIIQ
jgi:predicted RNase H-like nuclease